jgi:hypothetical protein
MDCWLKNQEKLPTQSSKKTDKKKYGMFQQISVDQCFIPMSSAKVERHGSLDRRLFSGYGHCEETMSSNRICGTII